MKIMIPHQSHTQFTQSTHREKFHHIYYNICLPGSPLVPQGYLQGIIVAFFLHSTHIRNWAILQHHWEVITVMSCLGIKVILVFLIPMVKMYEAFTHFEGDWMKLPSFTFKAVQFFCASWASWKQLKLSYQCDGSTSPHCGELRWTAVFY